MGRCKVLAGQIKGNSTKLAALAADHDADAQRAKRAKDEMAQHRARKSEIIDSLARIKSEVRTRRSTVRDFRLADEEFA